MECYTTPTRHGLFGGQTYHHLRKDALGPRGAIGLAAIRAADEPTERKIIADVFTGRSEGRSLTTLLDALIGCHGDQRFMLTFDPIEPVSLGTDISGIKRLHDHIDGPLKFDFTMLVAGELRMLSKEPRHFCLCLKPTRGKPLYPADLVCRAWRCGAIWQDLGRL